MPIVVQDRVAVILDVAVHIAVAHALLLTLPDVPNVGT